MLEPVDQHVPPRQPNVQKRSRLPWWGWLLIGAALAVPACGVMAALGIYGVRKYLVNAKSAEARAALPQFARAIVSCAKTAGALPPTSAAVPADLSSISGTKYQSTLEEWQSGATLSCAGFRMTGPQYFQYRWVRLSAAHGYVEAVADLDGNGIADQPLRQQVRCSTAADCLVEGPVSNSSGG